MKHFQDLSYCICSSQVWLNLLKKSEKIKGNSKNITKSHPQIYINQLSLPIIYLSDYSAKPSSGCHFVESAADGENYFVSLFNLAIFRDQGHIIEVVAVRQASQRNSSTITIPPPRPTYMLQLLSSFFSHSLSSTKTQQTTSLSTWLFTNLNPPLPNVGTGVVLLLIIHLGPMRSSPSECKSRFWEVILHEKLMKDWGLAVVIPSFIVVFWAYHLQWPQTRVTSEKSLPFQSLCKVFLQPPCPPPPPIWNCFS